MVPADTASSTFAAFGTDFAFHVHVICDLVTYIHCFRHARKSRAIPEFDSIVAVRCNVATFIPIEVQARIVLKSSLHGESHCL